jgi:hypothetical protein
MQAHGVQALLMGGQACILYGAAEFSRDADIAVLADTENLRRLDTAIVALDASVEYVPPFEQHYLERGHAVHFRCARDDVRGLRVDVMARMRGVDAFPVLWERRATFSLGVEMASIAVDVLALPDLVNAKKTQRDKDWPMIRRLLEASYFESRDHPTSRQIEFWFRELRTPELLIECARTFPDVADFTADARSAVRAAIGGDAEAVERELQLEQERERAADRAYWAPLRQELEHLRRHT